MVSLAASTRSSTDEFCVSRRLQRTIRRAGALLLLIIILFVLYALFSRTAADTTVSSHQPPNYLDSHRSSEKAVKRDLGHIQSASSDGDLTGLHAERDNEEEETRNSGPSEKAANAVEVEVEDMNVNNHVRHFNRQLTQESLTADEDTGDLLMGGDRPGDKGKGVPAPRPKHRTEHKDHETKEHLDMGALAEAIPELVHVPLKDAISGTQLSGWEDDWVAHASYDQGRWGKLPEPKIDFVYLCECIDTCR